MVETALVVTFLAFLVMGIVEVGFAFARTNMIVHGLREGARYGATLGQRNTGTGCLTSAGTTSIQTYVNGIMTSIGFTPAGGANGIMVTQGCNNSAPTIAIGVTGSLNTAFNLIGTSFSVNRSVTFEDEGRTVPPGGACNPC